MDVEELRSMGLSSAAAELSAYPRRSDRPRLTEAFPTASEADLAVVHARVQALQEAARSWANALLDARRLDPEARGQVEARVAAERHEGWSDFSDHSIGSVLDWQMFLNR